MKQWSIDRVCDEHGYDDVSSMGIEPHLYFINWLTEHYNEKEVSIIDVGCGSGRLLKFLPNNVKEYIGADINQRCVDVAKEYFKENEKAKFCFFDIEEDDIKEIIEDKVNIIYMDSTFTMLENPKECLKKLFEFCYVIYLGRTPHNQKETKLEFSQWTGMDKLSENWHFSRKDLKSILPKGWSLTSIIDGKFEHAILSGDKI